MSDFTDLIQSKIDDPNFLKSTFSVVPPFKIEWVEQLLIENYTYPKRFYHTWKHIQDCLEELKQLDNFNDIDAVKLAIYYHDCIYNPMGTKNEELSAQRAAIDLGALELEDLFISIITKHILLTKHNTTCDYYSGQVIMDVDLAILGKDTETFNHYETNIRSEYISIPTPTYKTERIKILQHFLNKPSIYQTNFFKAKYEEKARKNLKDNIKMLQ